MFEHNIHLEEDLSKQPQTQGFQLLVGEVDVLTSNEGGHSPEVIAELFCNRVISISQNANPIIRQQAEAFRGAIYTAALHYVKMGIQSHMTTVRHELEQAGEPELAKAIGRL